MVPQKSAGRTGLPSVRLGLRVVQNAPCLLQLLGCSADIVGDAHHGVIAVGSW
ncbi:hypothetical protein SFUMM280S_02767 [Streptomyces fumanus]